MIYWNMYLPNILVVYTLMKNIFYLEVHLGCRLNVALINRKDRLLRSLRNVGPSADHRLTINMPNTASY